ncbi:hypothetical protein [Ornithinicoccus hortensis]|uniref:Primosomal protein n=1 Tax=Ornithinicoccus hortensis TaxID=82346 RepID=A0A542YST9_9MICO|nr:hypothetical protein [Ornithinicoccus hortensis]TQL51163.1 hypothetical protein FB467_2301 [Ornithinicoccus hortensis]
MTSDPRAALSALVAALETHLELAAVRRGDDDPAVEAAYQKVADAFEAYDDALLDAYGEVTPLDIYTEDDEDDEDELIDEEEFAEDFDNDDEDDEFDDVPTYVGLDDDEYDLDDDPDDDPDDDADDDSDDNDLDDDTDKQERG